jgi:hypothetical protein
MPDYAAKRDLLLAEKLDLETVKIPEKKLVVRKLETKLRLIMERIELCNMKLNETTPVTIPTEAEIEAILAPPIQEEP